jgi:two-component sensor histidine kinase
MSSRRRSSIRSTNPCWCSSADLRVLAASRAFYEIFRVDPQHTMGCCCTLGDGQWDIPALRVLLETIIPEQRRDGRVRGRSRLPRPRPSDHAAQRPQGHLRHQRDHSRSCWPSRTSRSPGDRAREGRPARPHGGTAGQKQMLLQEMQHRVANSLQIIASILMLKARAVTSDETRLHLQDAHQRVLSVAQVQSQLHASGGVDRIEGPPLSDQALRQPRRLDGRRKPADHDRGDFRSRA